MSPRGARRRPRAYRAMGRPLLLLITSLAASLLLGNFLEASSSSAAEHSSTGTKRPSSSTRGSATTQQAPLVTKQGGTATLGVDQSPTGCNPNAPGGDTWANLLVLAPVLPSIFVVQPNGSPTINQAVVQQAELVSVSPQTIQYSINPKAVWSDGTPITAADFIYAWQQQRGIPAAVPGIPAPASQSASILGYRDIASVKGSNGNRTVTVVFKTPFAGWQSLFQNLLPEHVLSDTGWNPPCNTVSPSIDLSAGPFEIGSVMQGDQVVLVRNPRWWGTPPHLDRIVIRTASGSAQLSHWLADGESQVVQPTSFPESFVETVGALGSVSSRLENGTALLDVDFAISSQPLADQRVRMAVADAIDRKDLVRSTVGWASNAIRPAKSYIYTQGQSSYPDLPAGTKALLPGSAQPKKMTALLESAGYGRRSKGLWRGRDGRDLVLRMVYDQSDLWARESAAVITAQLRQAGIAVLSFGAPTATATGQRLAQGGADLAVFRYQATAFPSTTIEWYTLSLGDPGTNGSEDWNRFDNADVTSLLLRAGQQLNPNLAAPLYEQADRTLWNTMPSLPLFTEPTVLAWSSKMTGVSPNPYNAGLLWYAQGWGLRVPASTTTTSTTGGGG